MEITKVVKPVIRRGANTFGYIVYVMYIKFVTRIYRADQEKAAWFESD